MNSKVTITRAVTSQDLTEVKELFFEYEQYLEIDLEFQRFEKEIKSLPGEYAEPKGCILLARENGSALGTVALKPLDKERCEMKRLFVRSKARGTGIGFQLASAVIAEARAAGYKRMCLDTLSRLKRANALYKALGFQPTAPYTFNPHPDAIFLELNLQR